MTRPASGHLEFDHARREPLADDTCLACGYTRSQLIDRGRVPAQGSRRDQFNAALAEIACTARHPDGRALPSAQQPAKKHMCTACVKFLASALGLVARVPLYDQTIRCTTTDGGACPWGAELGLRPAPLTTEGLRKALYALGWALPPSATLFTCPRCVAALTT